MTATLRGYDRPIKNYIDELSATGHVTHKSYKKTSVTFHHNGGRLTHEGVLNVWRSRPASAHFDFDAEGAAAQYVKELEYAWAVANTEGNMRTISLEMCNRSLSPHWEVGDATWQEAARLAGFLFAKVIGDRPSTSNVFFHHHWYNTSCAGPFMDSIYNRLLVATDESYQHFLKVDTPVKKPRILTVVERMQKALELHADNKWGPTTDHRALLMRAAALTHVGYPRNQHLDFDVHMVQRVIDCNPDGFWGPISQRHLVSWVKGFQHLLDVTPDGAWGNATDGAFIRLRHRWLNNF